MKGLLISPEAEALGRLEAYRHRSWMATTFGLRKPKRLRLTDIVPLSPPVMPVTQPALPWDGR